MLSGDDPDTVAALAARAGLADAAPVHAGHLARAVRRRTGRGRRRADRSSAGSRPEQKERIVLALRRQGHYVAMVGDGVNDARALKAAQVGVAMRSGSAVTRDVADIVLLDDSIAALLPARTQGRRIISGIATSTQVFLARVATQGLVIVAVTMLGLGLPLRARAGRPDAVHRRACRRCSSPPGRAPTAPDPHLLATLGRFVVPAAVLTAGGGVAVYAALYTRVASAFTDDRVPAQVVADFEHYTGLAYGDPGFTDAAATIGAQTGLSTFVSIASILLILFLAPPTRLFAAWTPPDRRQAAGRARGRAARRPRRGAVHPGGVGLLRPHRRRAAGLHDRAARAGGLVRGPRRRLPVPRARPAPGPPAPAGRVEGLTSGGRSGGRSGRRGRWPPRRCRPAKPRAASTSATARFITCWTAAVGAEPCTWSMVIRSCWRQVTTMPPSSGCGIRQAPPISAPAPSASCRGRPASDSDAVISTTRVVSGSSSESSDVPVVGEALELVTEVGQPRPVLRRGTPVEDAVRATDAVDRADADGQLPLVGICGPTGLGPFRERSVDDPAGAVLLVDEQPPALTDGGVEYGLTAGNTTHETHQAHSVNTLSSGKGRQPPPAMADTRKIGARGPRSGTRDTSSRARSRIVAEAIERAR